MLTTYGTALMGRCDAIPGMAHVATKFYHIGYLFFVPDRSYVVLSESGDSFRGIPIKRNWKSIWLAYARTWLGMGEFYALLAFSSMLFKREFSSAIIAGVVNVAFVTAWCFVMFHPWFRRASFTRACQLARLGRFSESQLQALENMYGQQVPRQAQAAAQSVEPQPEVQEQHSNWYVASGDQPTGPLTWDQVYQMAAEGTLSADDQVLMPNTTEWIRAGSITQFGLEG